MISLRRTHALGIIAAIAITLIDIPAVSPVVVESAAAFQDVTYDELPPELRPRVEPTATPVRPTPTPAPTPTASPATPRSAAEQSAPPLPATVRAGPPPAVKLDGLSITIGSVERQCRDPWHHPPDGMEWVCLLIVLYNTGDETVPYSPRRMTLVMHDGATFSPGGERYADGLPDGNLMPGGSIHGIVRFEIPFGAKSGQLVIAYPNGEVAATLAMPT